MSKVNHLFAHKVYAINRKWNISLENADIHKTNNTQYTKTLGIVVMIFGFFQKLENIICHLYSDYYTNDLFLYIKLHQFGKLKYHCYFVLYPFTLYNFKDVSIIFLMVNNCICYVSFNTEHLIAFNCSQEFWRVGICVEQKTFTRKKVVLQHGWNK